MEIIKATEAHAARITVLAITTWIDTYATDGVRKEIANYVLREITESNIRMKITECSTFVVIKDEHILAFVIFDEKESLLDTLYVLPRFKRQGLGRLLLEYLKKQYGSYHLNCWEKNQNAIDFYQASGFREIGEAWFELEGEKHRNIVFKN